MPKAKVNGVEIAYTDAGQGDPVLFVHGFPFNKSMWEAQTASLSGQFRCIAVDLRGHGDSEDVSGTYFMDTLADDLNSLLDHLNIDNVNLVGFSMGGYVAFAFYRKYGQRVKALILADTRPQPDSPEAKQGRENTAQTVLNDGTDGVAQTLTGRMLAPANLEERPALAQTVKALMTSTPVNGWVGDLRGIAERPDSTDTQGQITCPTLILVGDQDAITPPADSTLMAESISGAKLVEISQAGHLTPIEQPEAFNNALNEFLQSKIKAVDHPSTSSG